MPARTSEECCYGELLQLSLQLSLR